MTRQITFSGSAWSLGIAVLLCIALAGCASPGGSRNVTPSRTVSLGEFAGPSQPQRTRPTRQELESLDAAPAPPKPVGPRPAGGPDPAALDDTSLPRQLGAAGPQAAAELIERRSDDRAAAASDSDLGGWAGGASEPDDASTPSPAAGATNGAITRVSPGEEVIVDSLIGQVNGRPIFADEFFAPIEAQLHAASRRMDSRQFAQTAVQIVSTRLMEVVQNELVLAEAEAALSQEERRGIFAFMRFLQEDVIAKQGSGTRGATERRLQEEEGLSLDEYLELEKNKALISKLIFEQIRPRVIVSWRDIEREYERRQDEYQPPATVVLSRIRLNTQQQSDAIEQVQQRLAAGEDFGAVAEALGFSDRGRWIEVQMGPGGVEDMEISAELRSHLKKIETGYTSAPFTVGSSTWWLHVQEIRRPPQKSIYDPQVQRELQRHLYNQRFREQHDKYIQSLLDRGIFDELDEMRNRLVTIAMVRYAPQ